jgi:hypothetical protein
MGLLVSKICSIEVLESSGVNRSSSYSSWLYWLCSSTKALSLVISGKFVLASVGVDSLVVGALGTAALEVASLSLYALFSART